MDIMRHYYHAEGYVAKPTPFFAKYSLLARLDGAAGRCDSIAFSMHRLA